jgi:acyl transferase domain-containing protein
MSATTLVLLFPGYGAYFPGALQTAAQRYAVVNDTLAEIDAVSKARLASSVRELLLDPAAPALDALLRNDPGRLQMAIYAASVCSYRILEARGCEPSLLVGHSAGEVAALVCAGAFSISQGAEIIAARTHSLKPAAGSGYMAAIGASPRRCGAILELLEAPQANVAVDNGPNQTVMSGATAAMDRIAGVAQALGVTFARLPSPYPFHSSQLVPVAKAFRTAISRQRRNALRVPVYSPILERAYEDKDDLAVALSSHLVRPVRFAATVRHLRQSSDAVVFVEVGASNALVKVVQRILSDANVSAFAMLESTSGDAGMLETTLNALLAKGLVKPEVDLELLQSLLPQRCPEKVLARFWTARGARILTKVAEEFHDFQRSERPPDSQLPLANGPTPVRAAPAVAAEASAVEPVPSVAEVISLIDHAAAPSEKSRDAVVQAVPQPAAPPQPSEALTAQSSLVEPPRYAERDADAAEAVVQITDEVSCRLRPATGPIVASALPTTRDALFKEIVALYAEATQYPREVFTEDVALEASLGIDSVKQTALLSELEARYRLSPHPAAFRLSDYDTLRKITNFIHQTIIFDTMHIEEHITAVPLPTVAPAFVPSEGEVERERSARQAGVQLGANLTRASLQTEIVALFAQAMEYPPEVFSEDVDLEGELGIDSVKQMELLSKMEMRYQLPPRPQTFLLSDYGTLRKVTDFIYQAIAMAASEKTQRLPIYAVG